MIKSLGLKTVLVISLALFTFSTIKYVAHSINNIQLTKQFIKRGHNFFKIDFGPVTTEGCLKFSTQKEARFKEIISDEEVGCFGLLGDFTNIPYADDNFETSVDFLEYIGSKEFQEVSAGSKTYFHFLMNVQLIYKITEKSDLLIDFLLGLIKLTESNPYFKPILDNCYPTRLERYCDFNTKNCQKKRDILNKIIKDRTLYCNDDHYRSSKLSVFNHEYDTLFTYCNFGFGRNADCEAPYVFWELNRKTNVVTFLNEAEFDCPKRNGHEIRLTANEDIDLWNKIIYFNVLKSKDNNIYTKLELTDRQTTFLSQKISSKLGIGVHVSASPIGVFDFQFFKLSDSGEAQQINHLNYPFSDANSFVAMEIVEDRLIAFFRNSILIQSLSEEGGKFVEMKALANHPMSHHVSVHSYDPQSGVIELTTVKSVSPESIVLVRLKVSNDGESVIKTISVVKGESNTPNRVRFVTNPKTEDIYLAYDSIMGSSIFTYFTKSGSEEVNKPIWNQYLGSLMDFSIDFGLKHFVFLVGDSPTYYGTVGFNNNSFNKCLDYYYSGNRFLRANQPFVTTYYAGSLQVLNELKAGGTFGICDLKLRYGTIGNSENAKVSYYVHRNTPLLLVSEQIALTREMKPFTNLWNSNYYMNDEKTNIHLFEIKIE